MPIKSKLVFFFLAIMLFTTVFSLEAEAQCQMCKATVESNLGTGGNKGIGLNTGILYLLLMPYLLVMTIAGVWYWNYKKRKQALLN